MEEDPLIARAPPLAIANTRSALSGLPYGSGVGLLCIGRRCHGTEPFGVAKRLTDGHAGMMFVADDLGAWLIGVLADAGRKKLTGLIFGSEQERALRSATTAAVQRTAEEVRPDDPERAEELAMVVSEVFKTPTAAVLLAGDATVLEALQAGIAAQLAVLDDASRTGTGQSSAEVLGISGAVVAQKLTAHLLREVITRGARGGPLSPLAAQLNDDVTHLQGLRIEARLGQLINEVREVLARTSIASPLPQGKQLLERYLEAVVRASSESSYRIYGGRTRPLTHVYQPLTAAKWTGAEAAATREQLEIKREERVSSHNAETITISGQTLPDLGTEVLLVGGPGSGKSTITQQLSAELARQWLTVNLGGPPAPAISGSTETVIGHGKLLPLRLRARDLANRIDVPWRRALLESVSAALGSYLDEDLPGDLLDAPGPGTRWLVIIDAIDEIAEDSLRARILERLRARINENRADHPRWAFLLTTRPIGDLEQMNTWDMSRYDLNDLDDRQLTQLGQAWLGQSPGRTLQVSDFLQKLDNAGLRRVARTPLFGSIALSLFEQDPQSSFPDNRFQLVWRFMEHTLDAWATTSRFSGEMQMGPLGDALLHRREEFLQYVLARRLHDGTEIFEAAQEWIEHETPSLERLPVNWKLSVSKVLTDTGFFVEDGSALEYGQYVFAEYLAGKHIARQIPDVFDSDPWLSGSWGPFLGAAIDNSKRHLYRTAIITHAFRVPEVSHELVECLIQAALPDLALLAALLIAEGLPCEQRTIRAFVSGCAEFVIRPSERDREQRFGILYCLSVLVGARNSEALQLLRKAAYRYRTFLRETENRYGSSNWNYGGMAMLSIDAAIAMGISGPALMEEAAEILTEIAADARTPRDLRVQASSQLGELGQGYQAQAVTHLRRIISETIAPTVHYPEEERLLIGAAVAIAEQGSSFIDISAELLGKWMNNHSWPAESRLHAARELSGIGGSDFREDAVSWLSQNVTAEKMPVPARISAAEILLDMNEALGDGAVAYVESLPQRADLAVADRFQAARLLIRLDRRWRTIAASLFMEMLENMSVGTSSRMWLAPKLASTAAGFAEDVLPLLRQRVAQSRDMHDRVARLADEIRDYMDPTSLNYQMEEEYWAEKEKIHFADEEGP